MDAIQFKVSLEVPNKFGKAVEVDTEKCVGCGVCVHKCPTKSIMLEHRKETTRSPKTSDEYNQLFVADRLAAIEKQA
jgi:NAD-dependent dihydropyrimidine dehydrogenase PreA subunit